MAGDKIGYSIAFNSLWIGAVQICSEIPVILIACFTFVALDLSTLWCY